MVCLSLSAGIPGLELPEHEGLILSPHVQPLFGLCSSLLFSNHAQCLVHQYKLNISQIPARLHISLKLCLSLSFFLLYHPLVQSYRHVSLVLNWSLKYY
jgi:hypothetical protein